MSMWRSVAGVALGSMLFGCGGAGPTPAGGTAPPAATIATSVPTDSQPTSATPGEPAGDPYRLPEGAWEGGMLHLETTGGIDLELDFPLVSGDTASGRTILTYENRDDDTQPMGTVRLVVTYQADAIATDVGGLVAQGPCTMQFTSVVAGGLLAGSFSCSDDLQALVQGDPVEVVISGTFTAGG
jgi:hypothetical protein